ncbi:unnamed protein product [Camellia sinensis]
MEFEDEIEEEAWEIERLGVQFKRLTQGQDDDIAQLLPKAYHSVPEMEAEYFPPKEDVILQNEAPTDLYILVTGAVDLITNVDGRDCVLGKAIAGDMFGEIGVLCYRPQPFTVRTTEISQILRMSRITLMNIIQENKEDGDIIMNNLFKKLTGMESIGFVNQRTDLDLNPDNRGTERGNFSQIVCEEHLHGGDSLKQDTRAIDSFLNSDVSAGKKNEETGGEMRNFSGQEGGMIAVNSTAGRRNDCSESNCSNSSQSQLRDVLTTFGTGHSSGPTDREVASKLTKRVTIHMKFLHEKNTSLKQLAKLIILPDSLEELLRIAVALGGTAGEKFGGYKLTKIVNEENAEIDDLRVIRDGDHLFLLQNV